MAATALVEVAYNTNSRGQTVLTKVEELINPITEWWDEELIRDVFWPDDVEVILSTPVHISLEDTLAWHFDNKGIFSVRSAYRVQRDHERRSCCRGAASSSGGSRAGSVQWKSLSKMGCPGKIRHFLWRFTHDTLALRMNWFDRTARLKYLIKCNRHHLNASGALA